MAGLRESLCLGPAGPGDGPFICGFVSELMCFLNLFHHSKQLNICRKFHQVCVLSMIDDFLII